MQHILELFIKIYLWFCAGVFFLYLPRISYYIFGFKKQKRLKNPKKNRLAVIVPARKESEVISLCLDSLKEQTYDPELFDIFVIVDDPKDETVKIASCYPHTFITVVENQTSKGEALDGALKEILAKSPDKYAAFIIVDADNIAESDFVEEMNNSLLSGRQIVCGKKLIKNWKSKSRKSRSFVANSSALTFTQLDDLGNKARSKYKMAIFVIGTGLMVRADVIKELGGWPYRSLTEDFELTCDSIIKGYTMLYYEHAKVYTEEAVKVKMAYKRRMRWIKGYSQCNKKYRRQILRKTFLDGKIKWRNFDFLYNGYPISAFFIVSLVATIFGAVSLVVALFTSAFSWQLALFAALIPLGAMYGVVFLFMLITLIVDWRNIKIPFFEKLLLLFFNPIYLLSYFRIFIAAFLTPYNHFKWEVTARIPFTNTPKKKPAKDELITKQPEKELADNVNTITD